MDIKLLVKNNDAPFVLMKVLGVKYIFVNVGGESTNNVTEHEY